MASPTEISDLVNQITRDVRTIISDEIALVKAEIRPSIRHAGVGSGLFGAAAYFIISATIVLWFAIAAGFAWLFAAVTPLSPWACVFLGTIAAVLLILIVAGVFFLLGGKNFAKIHGPEKAPESIGKTISAIATGIEDGSNRVSAEIQNLPPAETPRPIAPVGGTSVKQSS